jgi:hypothetical protein
MTVTKRMTGIDYRREWHLIQQSEKSLKAHVKERLNELVKKYPDMPMPEILINFWTDGMSTLGMIGCIEKIEEWSAEQQKVEQLYIEMPDELKKTLKNLGD